MEYCTKILNMDKINNLKNHGPSPIPQEGKWLQTNDIKNFSGLSHSIGYCAPQQGACKLTLNIKNGIIEESLIETIGCSGMTHSAAMAVEILQGKTLIEALNSDLVCDAINVAMREIFLQFAYGRTQTAFSTNGLPIGSSLEDLGKNLTSQVGTFFASNLTGPRYLNSAEGYIVSLGIDENNEIIGYKFLKIDNMLNDIKKDIPIDIAYNKNIGIYGRYNDAVRYIDPREK